MGKIKYRILINGGNEVSDPYTYNYGTMKNIRLSITEQAAAICYESWTRKTIEELTSFRSKLFRDAFRKVYLIHALLFNRGLRVKSIRISVGRESWEFDETTENFPFLFSVIQDKDQGLGEEWKEIVKAVLEIPKSKKDTELRFCAVFAYLAAKNRDYRIDRFTNLWTAMNAYGNYIARCYENELAKHYDLEASSNTAKSNVLLYGKDGRIVDVLSLLIKRPITMHTSAEMKALWEGYYGIQSALSHIALEEYEELYDEAWKALDDSYVLPEKYEKLKESAEHFDLPLFILLIAYYPYQLRCRYLHGSLSTLLFSAYNDYEIASLGVVNYFLERYLNQRIPEIFGEDFFDEAKMAEVKECMTIAVGEKSGKSEYQKALEKLVVR